MNKAIFDSQLLADGHLSCPQEFTQKSNALFKVIVTYENELIEPNTELSAIHDTATDFLSQEEIDYYLNLKEL